MCIGRNFDDFILQSPRSSTRVINIYNNDKRTPLHDRFVGIIAEKIFEGYNKL